MGIASKTSHATYSYLQDKDRDIVQILHARWKIAPHNSVFKIVFLFQSVGSNHVRLLFRLLQAHSCVLGLL
eukprot:IDg20869t1